MFTSFFTSFFMLALCCHWSAASYMLEVMLHTYTNPLSLGSNGNECEGTDGISCDPNSDLDCRCDNKFVFCLRSSQGSRDANSAECSLGGPLMTRIFFNEDDIDFSDLRFLGDSIENPLVFRGSRWPGAFLLFVQVIDDDDLTGDDHVDDIFIEMSLATSSLFTAPQTFVGSSNNARLELSFRVQCSPGFMGEDCTDEGGSETPGATPLGAIIGGTIGGAVLLIILVISVISITIVCVKKRRDSRASVGQPRVVPPAYPKRLEKVHQQPVDDYSMGQNPIYGKQISFDQEYSRAEDTMRISQSSRDQRRNLPPTPFETAQLQYHPELTTQMSDNIAYGQTNGTGVTAQNVLINVSTFSQAQPQQQQPLTMVQNGMEPVTTYEEICPHDYTPVVP